jgi:RNA polymerase sigma-70 factor (ECF subfamily)
VLATLVDLAQKGDEEAFAALTQAVGDRCMAIAYRILRDAYLAEDAVQTALTTAWHELPALRDRDRFEPWPHRTLVNVCYAEAKRRRHSAANVLAMVPESFQTTDEILSVHDRDQLERGLRRLPPDQRAVLVFHHYLGFSLAEQCSSTRMSRTACTRYPPATTPSCSSPTQGCGIRGLQQRRRPTRRFHDLRLRVQGWPLRVRTRR